MAWDESLASMSMALTTELPRKQPLENDPAERPQVDLKNIKWFMFNQVKKIKV
jgi:hypothetical protein